MRVVVVVQARLASTRLPLKALLDVGGRPMLAQQVSRLRQTKGVDAVVVACPDDDVDAISNACKIRPYGGPDKDLLTRILMVARETEADRIVRTGADCPLVPPDLIEFGLSEFDKTRLLVNWMPRRYPDGFDFDIWDVSYLESLNAVLEGEDNREWFVSWATTHGEPFKYIANAEDCSRIRLTVDYPEDLEVIRTIWEDGGEHFTSERLIDWCKAHPEVMKLNEKHVTDFGARPE